LELPRPVRSHVGFSRGFWRGRGATGLRRQPGPPVAVRRVQRRLGLGQQRPMGRGRPDVGQGNAGGI
ncbi:uncharacterized protein METZ01_LOCUS285090, partial [marine metagenome]